MKENFKNLLLENVGMKILSVGLAIIAWCLIMNISDPRMTVTIKDISVTKINEQAVVDENMIFDVISGETITVSVTGLRSEVQSMTAADINAYVDLKELSLTNACPIHVEIKNQDVAKRAEVVSKSEEVMVLSLEEMITDNKQISIVLKGSPAENYYAVSTVSPLMLEVYGSVTQVDSIEKLVATVDIEGKSSSFTTNVTVVPVDKDGNALDASKFTLNDKEVTASIELYPTKNINVVLDAEVTAAYGFVCEELEQAPKSVTISGPQNVITDITEIVIPFKRSELTETVAENINIMDYIPEGCYLVSEFDTVSVTVPVVRLSENKVFTVNVSDLTRRNLQGKLGVLNGSAKVSVSVWGAEGTMDELKPEDLGLYVDCSSVTKSGNYELEIKSSGNGKFLIDQTVVTVVFGEK